MRLGALTALLAALLACAPPVPASQAAHRRHGARQAVYRGKSAQGYRIQASASPGRITLVRFKVKMLCRDGSYLFGVASGFEATRLKADGRFADVQYGKADAVSWRGRASARRVSGTLRVKDRLASGVRCDSQPVRFTAKRAGR